MEEKANSGGVEPQNINNVLHTGVDRFMQSHNLNEAGFNKIADKYRKDKDFSAPAGEFKNAEKEYALDMIIDQLVEVKNGQWGKPVKLDPKAIKYIIDESSKIFSKENMLVEIEAPVKIFGDVHG